MKHYYTKIRNVFLDSNEYHVQEHNGEVLVTNKYVLAVMTKSLYLEHFVSCGFPIPEAVYDYRLTVKNGDVYHVNCPDLVRFYEKIREKDAYLVRQEPEKKKLGRYSVRYCDSGTDTVILNNKYYEAMAQATRGGNMYASKRNQPVTFYDHPEIYKAAFFGCVLPINYTTLAA